MTPDPEIHPRSNHTGGLTLLGIGGAHVDRIGHVAERHRPAASNPGSLFSHVGGGALNAVRAAMMRGVAPAGLISARGGDPDGQLVGETIEQSGITDMSAVFLDRRSASYTAILDQDGELITGLADMDIYETALPRQLRRRALLDAVSGARVLLVDANLPEPGLQAIITHASGPVFAIAISPAKVVRFLPVASSITVLFINRREMQALSGTDDVAAALPTLADLGFYAVVITGGDAPVIVMDGNSWIEIEPPPVAGIVDVTGAGDALAGATIARFIINPGVTLSDAVCDGIAAAQLTLQCDGPIAAALTGKEFGVIRGQLTIRPFAP